MHGNNSPKPGIQKVQAWAEPHNQPRHTHTVAWQSTHDAYNLCIQSQLRSARKTLAQTHNKCPAMIQILYAHMLCVLYKLHAHPCWYITQKPQKAAAVAAHARSYAHP